MSDKERKKKARADSSPTPKKDLKVGQWNDAKRPAYRKFPGPPNLDVVLRVTMEAEAYSNFLAHSSSTLKVEICGVLLGTVYEDEHGPYVHVAAIIRGSAAQGANTHVTFTQETWADIHSEKERLHPELQIVGWYHSHPGFGVRFSEMDLFIHKNFFAASTQIALLTDPLSGHVAVCVNGASGPAYLDRFWVDGREVRCDTQGATTGVEVSAPAKDSSADIRALEDKLLRFMHRVEDQRKILHSILMITAVLVLAAVLTWVGHSIYSRYTEDPIDVAARSLRILPVKVEVDGTTVLLSVHVVGFSVLKDESTAADDAAEDTAAEALEPSDDDRKQGD